MGLEFPHISRKNVLSRIRGKLIQDPVDQAVYGAAQASVSKQVDDTVPQQVSTPTSLPNVHMDTTFQSKQYIPNLCDEPSHPVRQITSDAMPDVGEKDGMKTLNLFWADRQLEKIVGELAKDKNRNDELTEAIHAIQIARYLVKAYGDRLRVEPNN